MPRVIDHAMVILKCEIADEIYADLMYCDTHNCDVVDGHCVTANELVKQLRDEVKATVAYETTMGLANKVASLPIGDRANVNAQWLRDQITL